MQKQPTHSRRWPKANSSFVSLVPLLYHRHGTRASLVRVSAKIIP